MLSLIQTQKTKVKNSIKVLDYNIKRNGKTIHKMENMEKKSQKKISF